MIWAVSSQDIQGNAKFAVFDDEDVAHNNALERAGMYHTRIRLWRLEAELKLNPALVPVTPATPATPEPPAPPALLEVNPLGFLGINYEDWI